MVEQASASDILIKMSLGTLRHKQIRRSNEDLSDQVTSLL